MGSFLFSLYICSYLQQVRLTTYFRRAAEAIEKEKKKMDADAMDEDK